VLDDERVVEAAPLDHRLLQHRPGAVLPAEKPIGILAHHTYATQALVLGVNSINSVGATLFFYQNADRQNVEILI
jgi:hypothetical protein